MIPPSKFIQNTTILTVATTAGLIQAPSFLPGSLPYPPSLCLLLYPYPCTAFSTRKSQCPCKTQGRSCLCYMQNYPMPPHFGSN